VANQQRIFYGWVLVGVAWVFYGFAISPAYYSWGLLARAMAGEIDLTREQIGRGFGLFSLVYSSMSAVSGVAMNRWGIRRVVGYGMLITAGGLAWLSTATSYWECLAAFGLVAGVGVGLSSIVPAQTLASNWFIRNRARAIAIIFTAGGIVGYLIPRFDTWMIGIGGWRAAWLGLVVITLVIALFAALFIRNRPEDMGLHPDGIEPPKIDPRVPGAPSLPLSDDAWTGAQALRTVQFAMLAACAVAYAAPWAVVISHGPTHLTDLGFTLPEAGAMIALLALISIGGRLVGAVGDFVSPRMVLVTSLAIEAVGIGLFIGADTKPKAYTSLLLLGIGFGTAYISVPVVMAGYFGRVAFAATAGFRTMIVGIINLFTASTTGWIADRTGSYDIPFTGLAIATMAGVLIALTLRAPGPAPHPLPLSSDPEPAAERP
jgi:MFS family permease